MEKNSSFNSNQHRNPLRELLGENVASTPTTSPNKPMELFDVHGTPVDTSLLLPSTVIDANQLDSNAEGQENQKPRLSILGGFDPLFVKDEANVTPASLVETINENQVSKPSDIGDVDCDTISLISERLINISIGNLSDSSLTTEAEEVANGIIDHVLATATNIVDDREKSTVIEAEIAPENVSLAVNQTDGTLLNITSYTDTSSSSFENTVIANYRASDSSSCADINSHIEPKLNSVPEIVDAEATSPLAPKAALFQIHPVEDIQICDSVEQDGSISISEANDSSVDIIEVSENQEHKEQLPSTYKQTREDILNAEFRTESVSSPLHDSFIEFFTRGLNISSSSVSEQKESEESEESNLDNSVSNSVELKRDSDQIVHMSEATEDIRLHLCDSSVSNKIPAEVNKVSAHNNRETSKTEVSFKECDVANDVDSPQPKLELLSSADKQKLLNYSKMMDRVATFELENEENKVKIAEFLDELKVWKQKSSDLESEVSTLKIKNRELNSIIEECKSVKDVGPTGDSSSVKQVEEMNTLRGNEATLKNENNELKIVVKQLENNLKELKSKEAKLADDLNNKTQTEMQISRVMEEYEKSISSLVAENERMKTERDTAQMHLANSELAFSDVHQKYERCKTIVQGFKGNEEMLRQNISMNEETILKQEQKYETLKVHAMSQLEKSNQELASMKKQHEQELARLNAQLKRFEIKNNSLVEALHQKSKECEQLSAVCDEFIGNV